MRLIELPTAGGERSPYMRRWPRRWRALGLAATLLAGCGSQAQAPASPTALPPTATATVDASVAAAQTATAQAFGTANARRLAAMLTPTPATATPSPAPTSTPAPTPAPASPAASATPTPYVADFAAWPTATPTAGTPARVAYDPATRAYSIAITDPKWDQVYIQYLPQAIPFGDFDLSVDVRQVAGPPNTNLCVVFDAQPKGPQDKTNSRYNLLLIPEQQRAGVTYTDASDRRTLLGAKPAPALKTDGTNRLQLVRKAGRVAIVLNGQPFGDYAAAGAAPGAIGLVVANPANNPGPAGAAAAFSNLRVTALSS